MPAFHKYHGAGNDFILLDDREGDLHARFDEKTIASWCNRHFGIGADGLMLLRAHADYDFEMVYYNSDGAATSLCGNGGRCIVQFAHDLGILRDEFTFLAIDGPHRAKVLPDGNVSLEMNDVDTITHPDSEAFVLDTGSPHYVSFVPDTDEVDVVTKGRSIRQSPPYEQEGINVNFVSGDMDGLQIATYERGVEDETLACGTGVTAAAIAAVHRFNPPAGDFRISVRAKGGMLAVSGTHKSGAFSNLWLEGPAVRVFGGEM